MKPQDYKHIAAWGRMMGSYAYFIKDQQNQAAEDNAPVDAIYKRGDIWHRFADVTNWETRRIVESYLKN